MLSPAPTTKARVTDQLPANLFEWVWGLGGRQCRLVCRCPEAGVLDDLFQMQAYMQPLKHQKSAALLTTKRVCGERGPVEDEEAR